MGKRPPNDLTADEWRDMRRAADAIDALLGDMTSGRKDARDAKVFLAAVEAVETIQSTINLVLGPQQGDE